MNEPMEDLAWRYVLDELDPSERARFDAVRRRDPIVAALVQELEATLAARVRALPQAEPDVTMLGRIEARIDRLPTAVPRRAGHGQAFAWVSLGAVAALVVVSLGFLAWRRFRPTPTEAGPPVVIIAGLASDRSTVAELPLKSVPRNPDKRFIQLATLAEQLWDDPDKLPMSLGSAGRTGHGYTVYDPGTHQGFVAVQQLPALQEGKRYHLWLVERDKGAVRDAGVLPLDAATRGLFFFSVPDQPTNRAGGLSFFITVEDAAAGADTPHGRVVLGRNPI